MKIFYEQCVFRLRRESLEGMTPRTGKDQASADKTRKG